MGDLSDHFSRSEFACKCGCGFDSVDVEHLRQLETIRQHFGRAVRSNSSCRCVNHNAAVGGSSGSYHLVARASDIVVDGVSPQDVYDFADRMGFGGVGLYSGWVHVDSRTNGPARWTG